MGLRFFYYLSTKSAISEDGDEDDFGCSLSVKYFVFALLYQTLFIYFQILEISLETVSIHLSRVSRREMLYERFLREKGRVKAKSSLA